MEKLVQKFSAIASDGTKHVLYVFQNFIDVSTREEPSATAPGLKRITTAEGAAVNRLGKGEYKINQTGELLRSAERDAP